MNSSTSTVETGRHGRVSYARIAPNEDLVTAVEALCAELKLQRAFVRGSLGSLIDACIRTREDGAPLHIHGPAVEIASLAGEIRPDADGVPRAFIHGVVADANGRVWGGAFVRGLNPICMTFELTLEEWLPDPRPALKP
ncbi:PPC domain-containing DNA-binding protein [Piscinibacter sp.]|uniref:PPC domain-containing DNA-binding protein n=1 Tax=Piscinibacter sp. TaxID=1903157 RepID=UPI0039E5CC4A